MTNDLKARLRTLREWALYDTTLINVEDIDRHFNAISDGIEALEAALKTVKRTLEKGQPAIACTIWADGSPTETLLDHVSAALAGGKDA